MPAATKERIISSDSHVTTSHDAVKANLASKFHDAYDKAVEVAANAAEIAYLTRRRDELA